VTWSCWWLFGGCPTTQGVGLSPCQAHLASPEVAPPWSSCGVAGGWPGWPGAEGCLWGWRLCSPRHPAPTAAPGQGCWSLHSHLPGAEEPASRAARPRGALAPPGSSETPELRERTQTLRAHRLRTGARRGAVRMLAFLTLGSVKRKELPRGQAPACPCSHRERGCRHAWPWPGCTSTLPRQPPPALCPGPAARLRRRPATGRAPVPSHGRATTLRPSNSGQRKPALQTLPLSPQAERQDRAQPLHS